MSVNLIKQIIPSPLLIVREAIIVFGGLVIAAAVISRFPKLQAWISGNSLTVKDQRGATLF